MVTKRSWTVICKGCKKEFIIREYKGLEGGRYGDHFCKTPAQRERVYSLPETESSFWYKRSQRRAKRV